MLSTGSDGCRTNKFGYSSALARSDPRMLSETDPGRASAVFRRSGDGRIAKAVLPRVAPNCCPD
jgi:hypothetical protein